jgi:2-polyprenyl-3-methyl-5-hydroxy-6-metoxy-1,4-benzoquinol methylase
MITSHDIGQTGQIDVETRARQSQGSSSNPVYEMVARVLAKRHPGGGVLVDVGCGAGKLSSFVCGFGAPLQEHRCDRPKGENPQAHRYIGVDAVRYDGFPAEAEFIPLDLDAGKVPLADAFADVVCAVETIEHLENPRAFVRELVRLTKPGGLVVVTTPNQLSLLSKLTLVLKNQFNAFQEAPGLYPAHITALLEIDLIRIFTECGLTDIQTDFTNHGRLPFTPWHWPKSLGFRGRAFSDNVLCIGLKPKV